MGTTTRNRTPSTSFNPNKFTKLARVFGLSGPIVTTIGNCTFNNNFRLTLTTSFVIYTSGTDFTLPRTGLNVIPSDNNILHLPGVLPPTVIGRVIVANEQVNTRRTLH